MAKQKYLVVGNWKMYIDEPAAALKLISALKRKARKYSAVEIVVAPPAPFIAGAAAVLKSSPIHVAAQSVSAFADPKHTGEVSGTMVRAAGATFAIVGHSERRALGESEENIALQVQHAVQAELKVILCVGEHERDAAGGHFSVIAEQLRSGLRHVKSFGNTIAVAYEPVWAIGKTAAEAMQPEALEESVIFIRKTLAEILPRSVALKVPILYGGSVEPENASMLVEKGGISGFLVGHASVEIDPFIQILEAVRSNSR